MNWQDVHVNLQYIDSAVVEVWFRNSTGDPWKMMSMANDN